MSLDRIFKSVVSNKVWTVDKWNGKRMVFEKLKEHARELYDVPKFQTFTPKTKKTVKNVKQPCLDNKIC